MSSTPHPEVPGAGNPHRQRFWILLALAGFLILLNVGVWFLSYPELFRDYVPRANQEGDGEEKELPVSFEGRSDQLSGTVLVPSLESVIPENQTALWCGTLALAWREFEKEVIQGHINLVGAEEVSRQIRETPIPELEKDNFFAAAGWTKDGIYERICRELRQRFPKAPLPKERAEIAQAYAYLEVALPFDYQFKDNEEPLKFKDSKGKETRVQSFGIREKDKDKGDHSFRSQVKVLYRQGSEFALDPSKETLPYQIILARLERKATLKDTLAYLEEKIKAGPELSLKDDAVLLVPSMHWKIDHEFKDLEGPFPSKHPGSKLDLVYQFIQFKLDRKGAVLSSGAGMDWNNGHEHEENPSRFVFDRPFLIVMKKRDGRQPFFVMWVANAELLQAWK